MVESPFLRAALRRAGVEISTDAASLIAQLHAAAQGFAGQAKAGDATALRRLRSAELARIALRSITGADALEQTLEATSALADTCIALALAACASSNDRAGGGLCVLGLGKLGGRELNFSSDVDLVFAYEPPAGAPDGDVEADCVRLAQAVSRHLGEVTAEGFVFRVDTLLRPFGSAGAPAQSFAAMERYFERHGREWERYAWIKARPVAGDVAAGAAFLRRLQPFVYRRYLDFEAVENLRELKEKIAADARERGREDDLKIGAGGIREIEFIVQLFQLTRGGQDARLRDTRLRPVLAYLGQAGLLPRQTATELYDAYRWLRRCENAVQMWADQQTHRLPEDPPARAFVCAAMGYADWDALLAAHEAVRRRVREEFEKTFAEPRRAAEADGDGARAAVLGLLLGEGDRAVQVRRLAEDVFGEYAEAVATAIEGLAGLRRRGGLGDRGWLRLKQLVPELLHQARECTPPGLALLRALELVKALAGRTTYLSLLLESATARAQLLRLCAASPWIAQQLVQAPALLDALIDPRTLYAPPGREELASAIAEAARPIAAVDLEAQMDLLRRFRQEMTLRIAASDVAGVLPIYQVSDRLTWLAEAVLGQALAFAWHGVVRDWGAPPGVDAERPRFAVIGYGKLGGIELGYGSDLDVIFLYDCEDPEAATVGALRRCSTAEFYARLAQRLISLLATQTGRGRAYALDLELRPSGRSGLLVSRLAGFRQYQLQSAWTWEQQALLRARPVAGDPAVAGAFEAIRRESLTRRRDAGTLRAEVAAMRERMRAAQPPSPRGRWDVKQARGGLIDAEFLIQYLCLLHAAARPALIEYTDNWRQIEALAQAGLLPRADADALIAAERALRGHLHRRALQQADDTAAEDELTAQRALVRRLWDRWLEREPA